MMKTQYILAIALLVLMMGISGCIQDNVTGQVVRSTETIDIGAILFLSNNDLSFIAEAMQQGIDIAVDEVNAQGGILGKSLRIVYEDDQFNPQLATNAAHKLLSVDKVSASLTGMVNTAKASGPIFEQAQTPLVTLWDVNKDLEDIGEYTYSIGFSTESAGELMAQTLYTQGARSVSVIRHQDEWSQLISDSFISEFKRLGGRIVVDESVPVGTNDFRTVLTKSQNTDAFFAPLIENMDLLFIQSVQLGYKGIMSTGDGMTQETVDNAQGAAEGVFFAQVDAPVEKLKEFAAKYQVRHGQESDLLIFSALGYDGVMVLKKAIEKAGSDDPVAIHNALYTIKGYDGVSGITTINENGSAAKFEKVFIVENGKIKPFS